MFDFVKFVKEEAKVFDVCTMSEFPEARPFGAISTDGNYLYIATAKSKKVYTELLNTKKATLMAINLSNRHWYRVYTNATICEDMSAYELLFKENPRLNVVYGSIDNPDLAIFKLEVLKKEEFK